MRAFVFNVVPVRYPASFSIVFFDLDGIRVFPPKFLVFWALGVVNRLSGAGFCGHRTKVGKKSTVVRFFRYTAVLIEQLTLP